MTPEQLAAIAAAKIEIAVEIYEAAHDAAMTAKLAAKPNYQWNADEARREGIRHHARATLAVVEAAQSGEIEKRARAAVLGTDAASTDILPALPTLSAPVA